MKIHLNLTQDVGHGITLIFICFVVVLAAVLIDLLVALVAEYKIGHSIESHKLRKSITKVILYYSALLYGVLVDVIGLAFTWYEIPYAAILAALGAVLIEGKSMWEKHEKIQSAVTELPEIIGKIIAASSKRDATKILELLKNKKDEEK